MGQLSVCRFNGLKSLGGLKEVLVFSGTECLCRQLQNSKLKHTPMQTKEKEIPATNTSSKELDQLDIFVGKWNVEGRNLEGAPVGTDSSVKGIATYEWLTGKFYLVTKWSRKFGSSSHIGIGIIGFDESTGFFKVNNYDNLGFARAYKLTTRRLTWKFSGTHERATMEFTPDGRNFTEYWEVSQDGSHWEPLCRLNGSKVS